MSAMINEIEQEALREWHQMLGKLAWAFESLGERVDEAYRAAHSLSNLANILGPSGMVDAGTAHMASWLELSAQACEGPTGADTRVQLTANRDEILSSLRLRSVELPPASGSVSRRKPVRIAKIPVQPTKGLPGERNTRDLAEFWVAEIRGDLEQMVVAARSGQNGEVRGLAHKAKSTFAICGYPELERAAHYIEELIDRATQDPNIPISVLLPQYVIDYQYCAMLAHDRQAEEFQRAARELNGFLAVHLGKEITEASTLPAVATAEPADISPASATERPLVVTAATLDRLMALLNEGRTHRSKAAGAHSHLSGSIGELRGIHRVLRDLAEVLASLEGTGAEPGEDPSGFTELELERFSALSEAKRRANEIAASVSEIAAHLASHLRNATAELDATGTVAEVLHQDVSDLRLDTAQELLNIGRLSAIHAAQRTGREITVEVRGGNTRLESSVLAMLASPIRHLATNAVAHGIEDERQRIAAHKPPQGQITLTAEALDSQRVRLTVEDDGKGVDFNAVIARARQIMDEPPGGWTSDVLLDVLCAKGFSTRAKADTVAGRGEGLAEVRRTVLALDGSLEMETKPGGRTTWSITVPVSISYGELAVVKLAGQEYGIPKQYVIKTTRFQPDALLQREDKDAAPMARLEDGSVVSVLDLVEFFGARAVRWDERDRQALLLTFGADRLLLVVDSVEGFRKSLLQGLDPVCSNPDHQYWCGVTVSSDSAAMLVIDPPALLDALFRQAPLPRSCRTRAGNRPKILVADDAVAIRSAMKKALVEHHYEPDIHQDGESAWAAFAAAPDSYAAVLTDIEMPRMTGLGLIEQIRALGSDVPIAVVTARDGHKHRVTAAALGANEYLAKPFTASTIGSLLARLISTTP